MEKTLIFEDDDALVYVIPPGVELGVMSKGAGQTITVHAGSRAVFDDVAWPSENLYTRLLRKVTPRMWAALEAAAAASAAVWDGFDPEE